MVCPCPGCSGVSKHMDLRGSLLVSYGGHCGEVSEPSDTSTAIGRACFWGLFQKQMGIPLSLCTCLGTSSLSRTRGRTSSGELCHKTNVRHKHHHWWYQLCLAFVLNRTLPEQVRPFIGDRDEVPGEQVPEQVRKVGLFQNECQAQAPSTPMPCKRIHDRVPQSDQPKYMAFCRPLPLYTLYRRKRPYGFINEKNDKMGAKTVPRGAKSHVSAYLLHP